MVRVLGGAARYRVGGTHVLSSSESPDTPPPLSVHLESRVCGAKFLFNDAQPDTKEPENR